MNAWSDWEPFAGDPYLDWRQRILEEVAEPSPIGAAHKRLSFASAFGAAFEKRSPDDPVRRYFEDLEAVLPEHAASRVDQAVMQPPPPDRLPKIEHDPDDPDFDPKQTVIVGVIDLGIPLGHNRFRDAKGKTRILGSWQQTAKWSSDQQYLLFGNELYADDINDLIKKHSASPEDGWFDEEAFNREAGIVDFETPFGSRDAAGIVSHGAHVLDLAAGEDPNGDPEFLKKVKIIAVNTASSWVFGASGEFFDGFILSAVQRILTLADAIWENSFGAEAAPGERKGFPIVINISFGKQAGAKNSIDFFPATLKRIASERKDANLSTVEFVMPAGNDNLNRCNAFLEPEPNGEALSLNWRVQPDDQSSNFVEVWTSPPETRPDLFLKSAEGDIAVGLTSPDGVSSGREQPVDGASDQPMGGKMFRAFGKQAAIYRETFDLPGDWGPGHANKTLRLVRHLICVAPTHRPQCDIGIAPAGSWQISVENLTNARVQCVLSVQTDQQLLPGNPVNRRSYFDDPGYRKYDESGRVVESYAYPTQNSDGRYNLDLIPGQGEGDRPSPVRRHGTMNASAAHIYVARVGGFRVSDGRPAQYSSTGRGRQVGNRPPDDDDGTVVRTIKGDRAGAPTASLPTEDGPMHPGILAAGAANGSVVALRGTSFASAQATRVIARTYLDDNYSDESGRSRLYTVARTSPDGDKALVATGGDKGKYAAKRELYLIEMLGRGRIERPDEPWYSRARRG